MDSIGLVLEGGGMRGVYTAGVLEFFAEQELYFPYIIGVSAGACNAASYVSRQRGRNHIVNVEYTVDPRYVSLRNWWEKRQLFGMDFLFDEVPNRLVPFDFEAFRQAKERFVIGTTDCATGQPVYFSKQDPDFDALTVMRASSSLPFIAPIVEYGGKELLDGGISDPIPVRQAERDGFKRNVAILTRNAGYRKKPNRFTWMLRRAYHAYPQLIRVMQQRHELYNETSAYIEQQARDGAVFVIQPQVPLSVGRIERNKDKLDALYKQGYADARAAYPALLEWVGRKTPE
ncbi:patatin-like phospholipase family protein [Paenibacillus cremeus]|uniref:Patatin family protein n=1 Tax=Paenibacillus cremeus TaxID=2163881 RepID=A0A559K914_9BACL|nr:patatin family protein [Paenibacillus cremeus]TVY08616.1 patatin family protein [Paenibacillus cremeus]